MWIIIIRYVRYKIKLVWRLEPLFQKNIKIERKESLYSNQRLIEIIFIDIYK